ncbi:acyltransferase [Agromyces bracchium]|uniref:acyltransferase n=1 Tax=Agromyces bracchium TaxID=88376 RepID=UPI0018ACE826|nr:acyltransferase [Agromyces bracchium]
MIIDVHRTGLLSIGDRAKVMHYTIIAVSDSVEIGEDSQIAESSSIRDSDHGMALGAPMRDQLLSAPVTIGSDVWVGRGVCVTRGSAVGDGAVIGANSVVRGVIPARSVAVGAPAVVKRARS